MTLNMTIPKTQNPGGAGLFNPTGGRGGGGLFNLFFAPPYVKLMRYKSLNSIPETPWFVGGGSF